MQPLPPLPPSWSQLRRRRRRRRGRRRQHHPGLRPHSRRASYPWRHGTGSLTPVHGIMGTGTVCWAGGGLCDMAGHIGPRAIIGGGGSGFANVSTAAKSAAKRSSMGNGNLCTVSGLIIGSRCANARYCFFSKKLIKVSHPPPSPPLDSKCQFKYIDFM